MDDLESESLCGSGLTGIERIHKKALPGRFTGIANCIDIARHSSIRALKQLQSIVRPDPLHEGDGIVVQGDLMYWIGALDELSSPIVEPGVVKMRRAARPRFGIGTFPARMKLAHPT